MKIVELMAEDSASKLDKRPVTLSKPDKGLVRTSKNEEALMRKVQGSPHIVALLESFMFDCLHVMVMEKCETSLASKLSVFPSLGDTEISRIFREMTLGVEHVHTHNVVHRDVKPGNYLLGGPEGRTVKLCDFGLSVRMPLTGKISGVCGTLPYMSPEIVADSGYDRKTDIWSLAATMYVALFGCYPYQPQNPTRERITKAIVNGVPAPNFTVMNSSAPQDEPRDGAAAFVRALLVRDPLYRFSAPQALKLRFIRCPTTEPTAPPTCNACRQRPGQGLRLAQDCEVLREVRQGELSPHRTVRSATEGVEKVPWERSIASASTGDRASASGRSDSCGSSRSSGSSSDLPAVPKGGSLLCGKISL